MADTRRTLVAILAADVAGYSRLMGEDERATVVDSERYFLTVMRYIELNPVRADMVAHPRNYRLSRYGRNANGETGQNMDWLAPHREYRRFGRSPEERQAAYRQLFRAAVTMDDLQAICDCTHKGWELGSTRFSEKIEALTQRRAVSKCVGRPRK
jgi:putative transposase